MNILLVDDDQDSRSSVALLLREMGHYVMEKENGYECLRTLSQEKFQLVLTDIKMPKISGMECLEYISLNYGDLKVVLFTGYGDMETVIEALRLGAYDFLIKPISAERLAMIIKEIEQLIKKEEKKIPQEKIENSKIALLTKSEREVLERLSKGLTNTQIASDLFISPATARNYVAKILQKLELENRASAIAFALKYIS